MEEEEEEWNEAFLSLLPYELLTLNESSRDDTGTATTLMKETVLNHICLFIGEHVVFIVTGNVYMGLNIYYKLNIII